MKNLLYQLEQQNKEKQVLLEYLHTVPKEKLEFKKSKNEWCVNDVIQHIVLGEKEVVGNYLSIKILKSYKKTFKNKILYYVVMLILRLKIPINIPTETLQPIQHLNFIELQQQWHESREQFRKHIENMHSSDLNKAFFIHPVCGPITTQQALNLSQYHYKIHLSQINKILYKA